MQRIERKCELYTHVQCTLYTHIHSHYENGLPETKAHLWATSIALAKRLSLAFCRTNDKFRFCRGRRASERTEAKITFYIQFTFGEMRNTRNVTNIHSQLAQCATRIDEYEWTWRQMLNSTANAWLGLSKRILNYIVFVFVSGQNRRFSCANKWTKSSWNW